MNCKWWFLYVIDIQFGVRHILAWFRIDSAKEIPRYPKWNISSYSIFSLKVIIFWNNVQSDL